MIDGILNVAGLYIADTLSALEKTARWIAGRIKAFISRVGRTK